jgi:hypothetical protein
VLFQYTENLSPNGTAFQSSDYHWKVENLNLTADLAITGAQYDATKKIEEHI